MESLFLLVRVILLWSISRSWQVKSVRAMISLVEYIVAPSKLLHGLLPANNFSIQGCVLLFDDPIIHVTPEDAENFKCDLENIRR